MLRVSVISVPRCVPYGIEAEDIKYIQLHGFADSSKIVYRPISDVTSRHVPLRTGGQAL